METIERVKEIHAAVDTQATLLLQDAPYDRVKVDALVNLGFNNAENVRDFYDHQDNHKKAQYYRDKYPLNRFITAHQLSKIRAKYDLGEGDLSRFKGSIPQRNMDEMLGFKIDHNDVVVPSSPLRDITESFIEMLEQSRNRRERLGGISFSRRLNFDDAADVVMGKRRSDFFENDRLVKDKLTFQDINKKLPGAITITADKALFLAPDPVLCPIVTVAVDGGYLIITAWGAEASHPDVVNEKMN